MWTFFVDLLEKIKALLLPGQYFSWQAVLYLGLFSWLSAGLAYGLGASGFTVGLLTAGSWLWFALGVGWAVNTLGLNLLGVPLAPWVAGALVCLYLFGRWDGSALAIALISWPLLVFLIIAVPCFVGWNLNLKLPPPPVRQHLIITFFACLLLSSWFQFYFRLQDWAAAYPTMVADDLGASEFVYPMPGYGVPLSPGVAYLSTAETLIKGELDAKPWDWVERWMLNVDEHRQVLEQEMGQRLATTSQEGRFWRFDIRPLSRGNGYDLQLWALWSGPSANAAGYYLEKRCQLVPVQERTTPGPEAPPPTLWASLECNLETPRIAGQPQG